MPKSNIKFKIPDRWEDYTNIGSVVQGTKFIAFKVPLSKHKEWNLTELKRTVPRLKHIIDLTNTSRYYQPSSCRDLGLGHNKIFVPGHVVPTRRIVDQFYSAVAAARGAGDAEGLIGVHCTHGLNRTGYLVCRYMIERDGVPPDQAIAAFDTARGHPQERENYLEHLKSKGWENEPEVSEEPRPWPSRGKHRARGGWRDGSSWGTRWGERQGGEWDQRRDCHWDSRTRPQHYGYNQDREYRQSRDRQWREDGDWTPGHRHPQPPHRGHHGQPGHDYGHQHYDGHYGHYDGHHGQDSHYRGHEGYSSRGAGSSKVVTPVDFSNDFVGHRIIDFSVPPPSYNFRVPPPAPDMPPLDRETSGCLRNSESMAANYRVLEPASSSHYRRPEYKEKNSWPTGTGNSSRNHGKRDRSRSRGRDNLSNISDVIDRRNSKEPNRRDGYDRLYEY